MKFSFLSFLFLLIASIGYAQYPVPQPMGSAKSLVTIGGGLRVIDGIQIRDFTDTAAANAHAYVKYYSNNMITTGDSIWKRNRLATAWILMNRNSLDSLIGATKYYVDSSISANNIIQNIYVDSSITENNIIQNDYVDSSVDVVNNLVSTTNNTTMNYVDSALYANYLFMLQFGVDSSTRVLRPYGSIVWDSGFVFSNTFYRYQILGQVDSISAGNFSIGSTDTVDRYVAIIGDTLGNLGLRFSSRIDSIAEIPTVNPESEIILAIYYIPAYATEPLTVNQTVLSNIMIYREHASPPTEWTPTTTIANVNYDDTTFVYEGAKALRVPVISNIANQRLEFTSNTIHNSYEFTYLSFQLRIGSNFTNTTGLAISFYNGNSLVNNSAITITNNNYGYSQTASGVYRLIVLPFSAFSFNTSQFNRVRITLRGSNTQGFRLDRLQLHTGGTSTSGGTAGVTHFNNLDGDVFYRLTVGYNYDTTKYLQYVNGVLSDSFPIPLRFPKAGTNITINRSGPRGDTLTFNSFVDFTSCSEGISGVDSLCSFGTTTTMTSTGTLGGVWSSSDPSIATINSSSGLVTSVSVGIDTIRYTVTNSCGTYVVRKVLTIQGSPTAGSVSGSSPLQVGKTTLMTVSGNSQIGYWQSSNSTKAAVADGVVTGIATGTINIQYVVSNSCGQSTASELLVVSAATNKVDSIWRIQGTDSIMYSIDGRQRSVLDSSGGSGGDSDSTLQHAYNKSILAGATTYQINSSGGAFGINGFDGNSKDPFLALDSNYVQLGFDGVPAYLKFQSIDSAAFLWGMHTYLDSTLPIGALTDSILVINGSGEIKRRTENGGYTPMSVPFAKSNGALGESYPAFTYNDAGGIGARGGVLTVGGDGEFGTVSALSMNASNLYIEASGWGGYYHTYGGGTTDPSKHHIFFNNEERWLDMYCNNTLGTDMGIQTHWKLHPKVNGTIDLGVDSLRWKRMYADTLVITGGTEGQYLAKNAWGSTTWTTPGETISPNLIIQTNTLTPTGLLASGAAFEAALKVITDNDSVKVVSYKIYAGSGGATGEIAMYIDRLSILPEGLFRNNTEIISFWDVDLFRQSNGEEIQHGAFRGATSLKWFAGSSFGVNLSANLGDSVFYGCTSLNMVSMPWYDASSIDNQTIFTNCGDLYSLLVLKSSTDFEAKIVSNGYKPYVIANPTYGLDVTSAGTIAPIGNLFHVTGTTNITSMSGINLTAGAIITLIFDGVLTFTDGSNLKLNGNFVTTADDTITLGYDGTDFYEISRSTN